MDSKISNLDLVESVTPDDVLPIVNNGITKKVKVSQLGGNTNLTTTQTSTNFTINSNTGTDATVPLGNGTLAGATSNDYTTTEKNKLAGIAEGAEVNVNADWNAVSGDALILNKPTIPSAITQTSQLTNNGADGVNPFITALDIPIYGQSATLVREVRNTTGATLTKGTVVYINGANGNKPTVAKALATTDALSARTFGLLQTNLPNNTNGYVVVIGDLSGLDTSAFTEGVQLYLSGVTAGTYTATKILAPTHLVYVGKVTRSHPTQGQIEVGIQNGYELEEIHDVAISGLANEDFLQYELSTDLWKNKPLTDTLIKSKLGITTLSGSNTGDNATNTQYSGLATSKQNTLVSGTNIKTINGATVLGSGNLTVTASTPSQGAYTVLANNTNASAIPTEKVYRQSNIQILSGTGMGVTGGTLPSGTQTHSYRWSQLGNLVTVSISLSFSVAGVCSGITIPFSNMPDIPQQPNHANIYNVVGNVITYGSGSLNSGKVFPVFTTPIGTSAIRISSDGAVLVYEFVIGRESGSYNFGWATIQYYI